ncbi:MAG: hypothetical protein SOY12_08800 [Schaedlerella sp.]|nr:hypothetical protein [Lachnospiraceae bacterium]MDY4203113.1 hypothetical protein [Schaedlerella sp.]
MKRRRTWKDCIREKIHCRPKWNRALICLRCSCDELCRILNREHCPKKGKK